MADLSRYLRRFRRLVSPPGRPAPAAVPADRSQAALDELAPVFDAIDSIAAAADRLHTDAEAAAREQQSRTEEEAQRILADARREAEALRAEAANRCREEAARDLSEIHRSAERELSRLREAGSARTDTIADDLVGRILHPEIAEVP